MDFRCLSPDCRAVLFSMAPLDSAGHLAMDPETQLPLESDGVDSFFTCPICGIKNVVTRTTSSAGLLMLKLAKAKR